MVLWINGQKYKPEQADKVRDNLLSYMKHLQKARNNEAVAHMSSMIENPKYEKAMGFLSQSIELITFITDYIQGIQV